jgi:hypothetical protein
MINLSESNIKRVRQHITEMIAGMLDYESWPYIDTDKLINDCRPNRQEVHRVLYEERKQADGGE